MTYNYDQEIEKMKTGTTGTKFKPSTGQYQVLFMSEPVDSEFQNQQTGEITPQIEIEIRVDGSQESMKWYIGKSRTPAGAYMQIMLLGKEKKGIKGQQITLLVKQGTGKDGKKRNEYTLVEALPLIKKYQEAQTTLVK